MTTAEDERLAIVRRREGWWKSAIVVTQGDAPVLRFERAWRGAWLAHETRRIAPAITAFLVHLHYRILGSEASATAAAASAAAASAAAASSAS